MAVGDALFSGKRLVFIIEGGKTFPLSCAEEVVATLSVDGGKFSGVDNNGPSPCSPGASGSAVA